MRKATTYGLIAVVALGTLLLASRAARSNSGALARAEGDAAFRDGVYQAKLDVQAGRAPHFRIGRWSSDADRASFLAGYRQSYQALSAARGTLSELRLAELLGFPDGVSDGAQQRRAAQPFQAEQTDNYRAADRGYSSNADHEAYRQHYRQAYSDGYRQGYHLLADRAQLKPLSALRNH